MNFHDQMVYHKIPRTKMFRDKRPGKIRQTQLIPNLATGQNPEQK
jgi:hypothetical protein